MPLKFTNAAEEDLKSIFIRGILEFGETQAKTYQSVLERSLKFIEQNPLAVRERLEISPPVRVHPSGVHIIIYRVEDDTNTLIIRVRHSNEDWISEPEGKES